GNGMTQIYFRGNEGWGERAPWEEIAAKRVPEALLAAEGVDLVAGQSFDGSTIVRSRYGEGRIRWQDGCCSYNFRGEDPLGCGAFCDLDEQQVLDLTFGLERPDALLQLPQL